MNPRMAWTIKNVPKFTDPLQIQMAIPTPSNMWAGWRVAVKGKGTPGHVKGTVDITVLSETHPLLDNS